MSGPDGATATALDSERLDAFLRAHPQWSVRGGKLCRAIDFADFRAAFAFMTAVALDAERLGHHPDWRNVYRTVEIELWTHDAGGLTERDIALATCVDHWSRAAEAG